jgi:hypothetical protein
MELDEKIIVDMGHWFKSSAEYLVSPSQIEIEILPIIQVPPLLRGCMIRP